MLKEFKEFAMKGNIMDLAIGVVIGGAFQKIVNSLVNDIIMPGISIITGKVDFSDMVLTVGSASIKYGNFITSIVDLPILGCIPTGIPLPSSVTVIELSSLIQTSIFLQYPANASSILLSTISYTR